MGAPGPSASRGGRITPEVAWRWGRSRTARSTASIMCGGVLNPKVMGSPILRYRTFVPAASTLRASATMFRIAYTKPPTRCETGMAAVVRMAKKLNSYASRGAVCKNAPVPSAQQCSFYSTRVVFAPRRGRHLHDKNNLFNILAAWQGPWTTACDDDDLPSGDVSHPAGTCVLAGCCDAAGPRVPAVEDDVPIGGRRRVGRRGCGRQARGLCPPSCGRRLRGGGRGGA